jgi:hypothetical protein
MTPAPLASYAMDVQRSRGRRFPEKSENNKKKRSK